MVGQVAQAPKLSMMADVGRVAVLYVAVASLCGCNAGVRILTGTRPVAAPQGGAAQTAVAAPGPAAVVALPQVPGMPVDVPVTPATAPLPVAIVPPPAAAPGAGSGGSGGGPAAPTASTTLLAPVQAAVAQVAPSTSDQPLEIPVTLSAGSRTYRVSGIGPEFGVYLVDGAGTVIRTLGYFSGEAGKPHTFEGTVDIPTAGQYTLRAWNQDGQAMAIEVR
jgi:hypothetical protein